MINDKRPLNRLSLSLCLSQISKYLIYDTLIHQWIKWISGSRLNMLSIKISKAFNEWKKFSNGTISIADQSDIYERCEVRIR